MNEFLRQEYKSKFDLHLEVPEGAVYSFAAVEPGRRGGDEDLHGGLPAADEGARR